MDAGCTDGMLIVGKIAFNPKEVLGRGSEGTFVYRFVLWRNNISIIYYLSCNMVTLFKY